ncbi:elements of external origin [Paracoccus litorisediminis]|uniref:Elements of external origin n=1 Tax=Paracoccus litorisediminis TaxID=2006130 RepID=A0A844HQD7_9RHOB|nr:elements of external origin [Paracoccus litorisediminis]MTH62100.1 elements of external origin [Paracoccus litorisediminis]
MGLSRRAYAASRKERGLPGGSDNAVRKAIDTGRISILPDGTIDPARADREWAEMTDPSQQRGVSDQPAPAAPPIREDAGIDPGGPVTLQKAKAALTVVQVQRNKLKLQQDRNLLVDKQKAERQVYALAQSERDSWLQLPARVAAQLAADLGCDAHALERALMRVMRAHLAQMAGVVVDLSAGGL